VPVSAAIFSRYVLRTTDVAAAQAFYDDVLGRRGDGIVLLPESAVARGARPHWLGHIAVRELGGREAMAARFVERGAILGPPLGDSVFLRDPGGAAVALTDGSTASSAGVVWHQLNTRGAATAAANYAALFGWTVSAPVELGQFGRNRFFAFAAGEPNSGLISGIESRPEVHSHWLFFFAVPSLDDAVERVRAQGGIAIGPIELPNGGRVAVCDDVQGAAFGLIQPEDAARLASVRS
jgi:uncharacterized protein